MSFPVSLWLEIQPEDGYCQKPKHVVVVMLCYVMLCYVMLCYVMLCYVMLCYVMLCKYIFPPINKKVVLDSK